MPLLLHGVGHVLPKGSVFLNRATVHAQIGARFTPDTGLTLRERAKQCRTWYEAHYRALHLSVATPRDYFWLLRQQYALRGSEVLDAFLSRWRSTRRFEAVIANLPAEGEVVFPDSGYGFDALVTALVRPDVQVLGIEPDEELRQVAGSIGLNPVNLRYGGRE